MKEYNQEELTLLHAELYDILSEVIRVCNKYNISYFAIGGTAIGALYDQAILPWDDDIDIGMTRDNYNRFIEIAPKELGSNYFLSYQNTDPHTPYYFAKVKKNNTLFVEELFKTGLTDETDATFYAAPPAEYLADGYMAVKSGDVYSIVDMPTSEEIDEIIENVGGAELEGVTLIPATPEIEAPEETTAEMDALVEELCK